MSRRRWEYMSIDCGDDTEHDGVFNGVCVGELNELGADGWEVVAVARNNRTTHTALLKREMPTDE